MDRRATIVNIADPPTIDPANPSYLTSRVSNALLYSTLFEYKFYLRVSTPYQGAIFNPILINFKVTCGPGITTVTYSYGASSSLTTTQYVKKNNIDGADTSRF